MNILIANLAGVKKNTDKTFTHYAKAGSRWPMTVGFSKTVDYYPFPFWLAYTASLLKRDTDAKIFAELTFATITEPLTALDRKSAIKAATIKIIIAIIIFGM